MVGGFLESCAATQSILFCIDCYRRYRAGRFDSVDWTIQFRSIVIHALPRPIFIQFLFSLSFSLFLFRLLLFYFPRCFLAIFSFTSFPPQSLLVVVFVYSRSFSLFFSPPSPSVSLVCARVTVRLRRWTRKDWCCTIAQTCLTASKRLRRTVPYRRNDFPPYSKSHLGSCSYPSVHACAWAHQQLQSGPDRSTNRCAPVPGT